MAPWPPPDGDRDDGMPTSWSNLGLLMLVASVVIALLLWIIGVI